MNLRERDRFALLIQIVPISGKKDNPHYPIAQTNLNWT